MIIHECTQYSTKWIELRTGIPTSSQFHRIITTKGKPSTSAEKYLFELLAERCMGHPVEEYMSPWMKRGGEMERQAVLEYEIQTGIETETVGFITTDDGRIGTSPDRLVGTEGLMEIKCPRESIQMEYLVQEGTSYGEYKSQVQGQLWITERRFVDLLAFHPDLPECLIHIERDEGYIETLATLVTTFSMELDRLTAIAESRGWLAHQRKKSIEPDTYHAIREEARQILSMES